MTRPSLRASSPMWASEASLARTRERLTSLTQIGELARRLDQTQPGSLDGQEREPGNEVDNREPNDKRNPL